MLTPVFARFVTLPQPRSTSFAREATTRGATGPTWVRSLAGDSPLRSTSAAHRFFFFSFRFFLGLLDFGRRELLVPYTIKQFPFYIMLGILGTPHLTHVRCKVEC